MTQTGQVALEIGLSAVIVTVQDGTPVCLSRGDGDRHFALPFGAFDPAKDRTFELALRGWVAQQTGFPLGHVEQLYTFGDQNRSDKEDAASKSLSPPPAATRHISVGYLALTPHPPEVETTFGAGWQNWYDFFPWEDHRKGRPALINNHIVPRLQTWAAGSRERQSRVQTAFGGQDHPWLEERVLERYELLYEAGLVSEASRDAALPQALTTDGQMMVSDHRRILATGISRLRGKLKYRPVIFDLMSEKFTLSALQHTIEAVLGLNLHKQNFRRALDKSGLVIGLGEVEKSTGGRPAELYQFRRDVLGKRIQKGVTTPIAKRP